MAPTHPLLSGTGFAVGDGPVKIDVYEDFMCPVCAEFERTTGPVINQLVGAGKVTVVYHPIAILDRHSSTQYSTRSAAVAAAAADGHKFLEFHNALFARQPAENTPGLSDDQLLTIGRSVGLTDSFATAVRDRKVERLSPELLTAAVTAAAP